MPLGEKKVVYNVNGLPADLSAIALIIVPLFCRKGALKQNQP